MRLTKYELFKNKNVKTWALFFGGGALVPGYLCLFFSVFIAFGQWYIEIYKFDLVLFIFIWKEVFNEYPTSHRLGTASARLAIFQISGMSPRDREK